MVGSGEVTRYRKDILEFLVPMELGAIIERDRLEVFLMLSNSLDACLVDFFDGSSLDLLDYKEACLPFDKRYDAMMTVAANHRIAFPVPYAGSIINFQRAVLDHTFAW